jgi:hypothetical protein
LDPQRPIVAGGGGGGDGEGEKERGGLWWWWWWLARERERDKDTTSAESDGGDEDGGALDIKRRFWLLVEVLVALVVLLVLVVSSVWFGLVCFSSQEKGFNCLIVSGGLHEQVGGVLYNRFKHLQDQPANCHCLPVHTQS